MDGTKTHNKIEQMPVHVLSFGVNPKVCKPDILWHDTILPLCVCLNYDR